MYVHYVGDLYKQTNCYSILIGTIFQCHNSDCSHVFVSRYMNIYTHIHVLI